MILVDTSIWIDHLHQTEPVLAANLQNDLVGTHPAIIEELAAGTLAHRQQFLVSLSRLPSLPVMSHAEFLALTDHYRLWGQGLSPTDIHLIGAVMLSPGSSLWTRDARLLRAADHLGLATITA